MYKKEVMQVYVVEKPFVCDKSCDLIKKIGIRYMSAINIELGDKWYDYRIRKLKYTKIGHSFG